MPLGGDVRIAVAGSPEYFERHAKPDTPDDLAAHDRPRYRFSTGSGIYRWGFTQPGDSRRVFEVETHGSLVSNDLRTMVKAVAQGVGPLH
ncbi:hypothetical protein [Paraburkholderia sp.]|uniref:hypothetical protein n=1 Tax=Paraburkholderia sp. TaxID=1926495 RepID=UPI002580A099|nr:hypothetical protein [Paraburkholderia sp.]